MKHCTTTTTKKSPRIKMGLERKKRREHCSKIELVLAQKRNTEGKKKQPKETQILERRGKKKRMYVLDRMVVTFPTCQAEMLALKANFV